MFFLIGLFLGALYGAVAQLVIGIPILFCRGFGLLWGERRLWWSIALLLAIVIGHYFVSASNRHTEVTDQLQRGFVYYQSVGVFIGSIFIWLEVLLILWKVGTGWKAPSTGVAPIFSALVLIALSASAFLIQKKPAKVQEARASIEAACAEAIQAGDLASVREMAKARNAIWSHSPGLPSGPIVAAVNQGDTKFVL